MRKTKIVATLGPSTDDEEIIKNLILAGMSVARINMSHGTYDEHKNRIEMVKKAREELSMPVALMLDTKGPEVRIKQFAGGSVFLANGSTFRLTIDETDGDKNRVGITYKQLYKDLKPGDTVLANDGMIELKVTAIEDTDIVTKVIIGGILTNNKSLYMPGIHINMPYLSEADKSDLLFGIEQDIDFIAASFVNCADDLNEMRKFILDNGAYNVDIIAKIESRSGVENIDEILEASDGIMVARGDMGVELPFIELPHIQKELISKCRLKGKRVITATEMLESMIHNPRPTRAETSDVANAVYDGTSAIMLSGETAAGKYPVEAVKTMAKIAESTENAINYEKVFRNTNFTIKSITDAISHAACNAAFSLNVKAIVVATQLGWSARMISRFRTPFPIVAVTIDLRAYYQLALSWGVTPILGEVQRSSDKLFEHAVNKAKEYGFVAAGDMIVSVAATKVGKVGGTNTLRAEKIK